MIKYICILCCLFVSLMGCSKLEEASKPSNLSTNLTLAQEQDGSVNEQTKVKYTVLPTVIIRLTEEGN